MAASLLYASDELHEKLADAESKSKADTAKWAMIELKIDSSRTLRENPRKD